MKTVTPFDLATALDLTHRYDNRGPRTHQARQRVAHALDIGAKVTPVLHKHYRWLMYVASPQSRRNVIP